MKTSPLNTDIHDRLTTLATACRSRIIAAKPYLASVPGLKYFPQGSCSDTSWLLAKFLQEQGVTTPIIYAAGQKGRSKSHAWLEIEGWVVDITADQFAQNYPEVWVLPASESEFHKSFKRDPVRRLAILAEQDANTLSWAARGYGLVMRKTC